jgi:hypothetical protein
MIKLNRKNQGNIMQKLFGFLFILLSAGVTVWYPLGKLLG